MRYCETGNCLKYNLFKVFMKMDKNEPRRKENVYFKIKHLNVGWLETFTSTIKEPFLHGCCLKE